MEGTDLRQRQEIREGRTPKEQDGDMSVFPQTKFPFAATINNQPVTVWSDWIEREEPPID